MIDKDVQAYVTQIYSAGYRISYGQAHALSVFARSAKTFGYWDKLIEVIPMAGETKEAALYKLKSHASSSNPMTQPAAAFPDAYYSPRAGFFGDGFEALNTGYVVSTMLGSRASFMLALGVVRRRVDGSDSVMAGAWVGNGASDGAINFQLSAAGNLNFADTFALNGGGNLSAGGGGTGFYVSNRTATNALAWYRNGTEIATTATDVSAVPMVSTALHLHGRYLNDAPSNMTTHDRLNFCAIGTGFTATDVANLSVDYAELMRRLRRSA